MNSWTKMIAYILISAFFSIQSFAKLLSEMRFLQVAAKTKEERSQIVNTGMSIESIRSDSVWGFANQNSIERLKEKGFLIFGNFDLSVAQGGHQNLFGFPPADSKFHDYLETLDVLRALHLKHADITRLHSIGKTIQNRDILAMQMNTTPGALNAGFSSKPGVIFMGNHHAREHLSVEVPLLLAQYLLDHRSDPRIGLLLDTRDIWIIPMVNPDGSEFDIAGNNYRYWRKNRRDNGGGTHGVDLNRNYGFKWGTGGSSSDPSSDIYMGKAPFSEPESQAIRDFVRARLNAKVLLTFHTFSELVLYPWGHTYDSIGNNRDLAVFEKMAQTMAVWNHYRPQQSSDLYIASGDTTDWAYGELGIFAFTFELSPTSLWDGGFYPGAGIIDRTFESNLQPCLYLIDVANDPYKVLDGEPLGGLKNYVAPQLPYEMFWGLNLFKKNTLHSQ